MSISDEITKQNKEKSISDFEKYSSNNTEYNNKKNENKFWSKVKDAFEPVFKFWLEIFTGGGGARTGNGHYGRPPRHYGSDFRETYRVEPRRISHEDLQRRLTEFRDVEKVTGGEGDPPAPCDCKHER